MMNGINCNAMLLASYIVNNKSDLYLVFGYGYKTLAEEKAARLNNKTRALKPKTFCEFLGIPTTWIIANFDKFAELLDDQNRVRDLSLRTLIEKTCGGMQYVKNGFCIVRLEKTYEEFEKGDNGTRSSELEKALAEQTRQKWIGGLNRSAACNRYGVDMLDGARIVPDLWNDDDDGVRHFTEVKCSRGHMKHEPKKTENKKTKPKKTKTKAEA